MRPQRTWAQLGLVLLLAALPLLVGEADRSFYLSFGGRVLIYAIAAVALNIALGFGGMVSLGHALYLGLGLYIVRLIAAFHGGTARAANRDDGRGVIVTVNLPPAAGP